jgi:hypothetical protein
MKGFANKGISTQSHMAKAAYLRQRGKSLIYLNVVIVLFLTGCVYDHFNNARIINKTNGNLSLVVTYDKIFIDSTWGDKSYVPYFLKYGLDSDATLTELDTIKLIAKYELKKNTSFEIGLSSNLTPDFVQFKRIIVLFPNNERIIVSQNSMINNFKKNEFGEYVWEIQN